MMSDCLSKMLKRYGCDVTIIRGSRTEAAKAFVLPLRRQSRAYLNGKTLPTGYCDGGYSLYIGDKAHPFCYGDGAVVACRGREYTVAASHEYCVGDEVVYIWAVLQEKKVPEDDYENFDG